MHCHNDLGLAAANSLAGMEAGATQIHCTINGLGERTGIPSLAEISVALSLIYQRKMDVKMDTLKELSELLESYVGIPTYDSMPLVGKNAYRHKAGTHVAAIIREPAAYEITPPRTVGNSRKIIFGDLSGRNEAAFLLRILGLNPNMDEAFRLTQGLKKLRCGDLFELTLSEELEKELIKT
jgi:2-isopropylmalate synthase